MMSHTVSWLTLDAGVEAALDGTIGAGSVGGSCPSDAVRGGGGGGLGGFATTGSLTVTGAPSSHRSSVSSRVL